MADEQQATPSIASDTATPNEENIEDQREREQRKIMQAISDELCGYFKKQVEEEDSFSIKIDYDSDVDTSQNGDDQSAEKWEVKFTLSEKEPDNDEIIRIGFEVESTPYKNGSGTPKKVSEKDKGYFCFKTHENKIDISFYSGKTYNIISLNEENEVVEKDLTLGNNRSQRSVHSEILEVWFPSSKSQTTALQRPISLSENNDKWIGVDSPHWIKIEDELEVKTPKITIEDGKVDTKLEEWWNAIRSIVSFWTVAAVYSEPRLTYFLADIQEENDVSSTEKNELSEKHWGLPQKHLYDPVRPVNLNPNDIISNLEDEGLHFPWHVIESACAALNAGKNVIFTGPPGCGKSKLASFLAREATQEPPLMATASPAWTSGDLIGRYMPARNGKGLVFREGFLLRAVPQNSRPKWLIIDEFNRADIDSCFGELFSVLAGDAVQLPFEKLTEGDGELVEEEEKTKSTSFVRIIPAAADDVKAQAGDYRVPRLFRLLGTMNDADRSGLNNLSFALMRRFAFVPVEAPSNEVISQIINGKSDAKGEIGRTTDDLNLEKYSWHIVGKFSRTGSGESKIESIGEELNSLFCISRSDHEFDNLISSRSVGIAIIKDVIRFVGEGMRAPGSGKERWVDFRTIEEDKLPLKLNNDVDRDKVAEMLVLSYLALALVLQVFPQLESLEQSGTGGDNKLQDAIKHIFWSMHVEVDSSSDLRMLRIAKNDEDPSFKERVLKSDQTIAQFLFENLKTRLPNLDASRLRDELAKEDWAEDNWDSKEL